MTEIEELRQQVKALMDVAEEHQLVIEKTIATLARLIPAVTKMAHLIPAQGEAWTSTASSGS